MLCRRLPDGKVRIFCLASSFRRCELPVVNPKESNLALDPLQFVLREILKSRKRHTARQANLILGRTGGSFWQRESYDHWIRHDEEKGHIRRYIRMNPVRAGLCEALEDWK